MADARERILVVDDHPDNRDLLSRRLERKGYEADTAADGHEAIEKLRSGTYDAVLLDVRMPGLDGMRVLETIREVHSKLDLPVLMVTAETDSAEVVRAMTLGANDYITKPVDFPVALARLQTQLSIRSEISEREQRPVVLSSDTQIGPGFVLDRRYTIESRIGEGGFAVVYRARQESTGQTVAVKIMRADRLAQMEGAAAERERFLREIDVVRRLRHPNIVRLIDSGELLYEQGAVSAVGDDTMEPTIVQTGGSSRPSLAQPDAHTSVPYLVTEHLRGDTLHSILRQEKRTMEIPRALTFMLPVLSAMQTAHDQNVIHRDLTPSNIFLDRSEGHVTPKVLDFGIAKLTGEVNPQTTMSSAIIGTPSYMSPEQARGEKLGASTDQYTAGIVLYECLTGSRPYHGANFMSILLKAAAADYRPPRQLNPQLPEPLEEVLLRSMSRDPDDRWPSANAFGRALLPFADDATRARWTPIFEYVSD